MLRTLFLLRSLFTLAFYFYDSAIDVDDTDQAALKISSIRFGIERIGSLSPGRIILIMERINKILYLYLYLYLTTISIAEAILKVEKTEQLNKRKAYSNKNIFLNFFLKTRKLDSHFKLSLIHI